MQMKSENERIPEVRKILQLLELPVYEHEVVVSCYLQKQKILQYEMVHSCDIRERIRLQNTLMELDDAFLDYQSSIHRDYH